MRFCGPGAEGAGGHSCAEAVGSSLAEPTDCCAFYRTRTLSDRAMQRRTLVIAAVAVVVVLAIGLTQLGGTSGEGGGGDAPSLAEAKQLLAGAPAALAALHENASELLPQDEFEQQIEALKGYPIVVNVWGSWCVPCRQEFPVFQRVSAKLGKRVAFLGIDTQDPEEDATKFLRAHPLSYPSYQDFQGELARGLGLIGTPATIYYDAKGKKAYLHQGPYRTDAALEADIAKYAGA
jgi:cytochrome c biogenesis protein CcmG/thiol:disulfide interchange protein DsbE